MVMGDLVLFEDEVNPVMSAALDNGLEVTALHNHFFFDSPRVMVMHIGGHGSIDGLASAVRKAMDKVQEIRRAAPSPATQFPGPPVPEKWASTRGRPLPGRTTTRSWMVISPCYTRGFRAC